MELEGSEKKKAIEGAVKKINGKLYSVLWKEKSNGAVEEKKN
jgi:hypothetical protein